jgi:predicted extracellular nuclease
MTPGYENHSVSYKSMASIGASSSSEESIIINEISAGEQTSIYDEDGDFSDFIELYNTSDQAVDIGGYFLSDDSEKTSKFVLPDYTMQPGEYLVIFASGKTSRAGIHPHQL